MEPAVDNPGFPGPLPFKLRQKELLPQAHPPAWPASIWQPYWSGGLGSTSAVADTPNLCPLAATAAGAVPPPPRPGMASLPTRSS
jgi:hypothetical protein